MGLLSFLEFGNNKIKQALKDGAVIIDVRTATEYGNGKIPGSVNIPVDRISVNIRRIREMSRPIICCCASGTRSSKAVSLLKENGLKEVYNGGNWITLMKKMKGL